jgi:hypothetical protein
MPGARCTRSLMCKMKKAHEPITTSEPENPAFPHANGFNGLLRGLPGEPACCHHPQRNAKHCRQVDTSIGVSGRHDFAVRNIAVRLSATPRPPHPRPTFRDDREAPLLSGRDGASP